MGGKRVRRGTVEVVLVGGGVDIIKPTYRRWFVVVAGQSVVV